MCACREKKKKRSLHSQNNTTTTMGSKADAKAAKAAKKAAAKAKRKEAKRAKKEAKAKAEAGGEGKVRVVGLRLGKMRGPLLFSAPPVLLRRKAHHPTHTPAPVRGRHGHSAPGGGSRGG